MHLGSADASTVLVSGADKLHNARAIVSDLHAIGDAVWGPFNARVLKPSGIAMSSSRPTEQTARCQRRSPDELDQAVHAMARGA